MPTPFFGDADIPFMLEEVGVPVTAGGVDDGFGILDLQDQVEQLDPRPKGRGMVTMRAITLVVQTSLYPVGALAIDQTIVADGIDYAVLERLSEGDGATTKLMLRRGTGTGILLGPLVKHFPNETPDGVRTTFTFTSMPSDPGLSVLVWNGLVQNEGAGDDYVIAGGVLTTSRAPRSDDSFFLYY